MRGQLYLGVLRHLKPGDQWFPWYSVGTGHVHIVSQYSKSPLSSYHFRNIEETKKQIVLCPLRKNKIGSPKKKIKFKIYILLKILYESYTVESILLDILYDSYVNCLDSYLVFSNLYWLITYGNLLITIE